MLKIPSPKCITLFQLQPDQPVVNELVNALYTCTCYSNNYAFVHKYVNKGIIFKYITIIALQKLNCKEVRFEATW